MIKSNILKMNVLDSYEKDALIYAIEVNKVRMIPDYRDGLKPVHRRIIYTMGGEIRCINRAVKCATIVGEVMGKYHPHGDSSIYGALCSQATWYKCKEPLITGQGNLGTIQGDKPAAMRYTEAKLSPFGYEMIYGDLSNTDNIVDWEDTFDRTRKEPMYLPAVIPYAIINGNVGIGYGIKSEIPKHNLAEVIDTTINLIKNPDAEVVLIPDHCQQVDIINTNFKAISNKGHGSYKARAIVDIEETKSGRFNLVIKSIPDYVTLDSIIEKIYKFQESKAIQLAADISDESKGDILRTIVPLKKGVDPYYTREFLYKNTSLEESYNVNFIVINDFEPVRMSYKNYLEHFIEFRKLCKFRYYCNIVQDYKTKFHEREAFMKVRESGEINKIIQMIQKRTDSNDHELIEYLIKKLKITDLQAGYIINANIKKLSLGYLNKYKEEALILDSKINEVMEKIVSEEVLVQEIIEELESVKKRYGKPRTSKVIDSSDISEIPVADFKIVISEDNYIKKIPAGFSVGTFKGTDKAKHVMVGCNTKAVLLFDENGRVFRLPIHKLMPTDKSSNGTDLRTIIKNATGNIVKMIYEPQLEDLSKQLNARYFVVSITESGIIKKLDLEDFFNVPASGIFFAKTDGDRIIHVGIYNDMADLVVFSGNKALRFPMTAVPHLKRNSKGMKSIMSGTVDGINYLRPGDEDILVITEHGYINRISGLALPKTVRNKPASAVIKLSQGDKIHAIMSINSKMTGIKIKTITDVIDVALDDIPVNSSASKGAKILSTKSTNIIGISPIE